MIIDSRQEMFSVQEACRGRGMLILMDYLS